jgi:hypothetical protein
VGLVTPIPNRLAVPLIEGIVQPVLAQTERASALFPEITPKPYRRAVELAVADGRGRLLSDRRSVTVNASPANVFATFTSLGGRSGWRVWNAAWQLRGLIDRLLGGPGLRRGRRHPHDLAAGDTLDFWRVDAIERHRLLRLRAEMRVPGQAWLEWKVEPDGGRARLTQTATFAPRGLMGVLYWYVLLPLHARIFDDLARAVAREAESARDANLAGA